MYLKSLLTGLLLSFCLSKRVRETLDGIKRGGKHGVGYMLAICRVVIVAFAGRPQNYGAQIMGSTRDRKKGPRRNSARAELARRGMCLG